MFYGPCLGERGLVRDLWRFTVKFFFYQREHRTNLQPDMKGCFIEVLYQGEKKQLSQKLNFLAKINF